MRKEKLQEILDKLEQDPGAPLLLINDAQALDVIGQVARRYPGAKLILMRGMRYITVTDEATTRILEQLERERLQYAKVLANYDQEIAEIRGLLGSKKRYYSAPDSLLQM